MSSECLHLSEITVEFAYKSHMKPTLLQLGNFPGGSTGRAVVSVGHFVHQDIPHYHLPKGSHHSLGVPEFPESAQHLVDYTILSLVPLG